MNLDFIRVGAAAPAIRLADCKFNAQQIYQAMAQAAERGCQLLVLPELGLTGSTCGDLFHQPALVGEARDALVWLAQKSASFASLVTVVGLPTEANGKLYNAAAVLCGGEVLGIVPKIGSPGGRHFAAPARREAQIIFRHKGLARFAFAIEIGEDALAPAAPSVRHAPAGATIILNPSAVGHLAGDAERRRVWTAAQSARLHCAYVHAGAGGGESTANGVYAGHHLIAEAGTLLAEALPFDGGGMIVADLDVGFLAYERVRSPAFHTKTKNYTTVVFDTPPTDNALSRAYAKAPFVPGDALPRCRELMAMQTAALAQRLQAASIQKVVLALSGGLDSALALLVAVGTFDALGLGRQGIHALYMPGPGSSARSRQNAERLAQALAVDFREISIAEAVRRHFADINHDENIRDLVFENAQARERTQIAMDVAAQVGGLMLGTGCMSELALGFTTFGGDHMSMYNVNAGLPKTLSRPMLKAMAEAYPQAAPVLADIADAPVSPELLPPDAHGDTQQTEKIIGPYALHDFFLYHKLRRGASAEKCVQLACHAFKDEYDSDTIRRWHAVFERRFRAAQFKRSCAPDSPRLGSVCLSGIDGWRMPSDVPPPIDI
jgi:NAD+ synthase (glutamine-hydrolysing)